MVYISLIFTIIFSVNAISALPKMLTKIPLDTIRFISHDGKTTLYQKRSGALAAASNFDTENILGLDKFAHFIATSNKKSNYIAIEADNSFVNNTDALKNNTLYLLKRNEAKAKKIGDGKELSLHLSGSFITYYKPRQKKIIIAQTANQDVTDEIQLSNHLNPYFIPQKTMIDANTFIYSDLNTKGLAGILYYNRSSKTIKPVFKSSEKGTRLEVCLYKNQLIIGEFTYPGHKATSSIYTMKATGDIMKNKLSLIYSSEASDPGHLTCTQKSIYFIKDVRSNGPTNNRITELFSLDFKTKKIKQISNLKKVAQVINMDDRILIPITDDYYVVEGNSNIKSNRLETKDKK